MLTFCSLIFDKSAVETQRGLQRIGVEPNVSLSFEDFEVFLYDTVKSEFKSKDMEVRTYCYEYDLETKSSKHFEIKKSKLDRLHPQSITSSSSLRCALI